MKLDKNLNSFGKLNMITRTSTLLIAFIFFTKICFAWGQTGHRVVGFIAEQHLNEKTKKALQEILGNESLAIASTWMDEIKSDKNYDHTHDWHWVTVPDGENYDATEKNKNGDVIEKINFFITELKTKKVEPEKAKEYIRMLTHLIGDIHQPLHVGKGDDKGGNNVKVTWFGKNSNLHRVWDSEIIDDKQLSYTEMAASINFADATMVKNLQTSSVNNWVEEAISHRKAIYSLPEDLKLGYEYAYIHYPLVKKQLLYAGIRLAGVLNEIYG